MQNFLIGASLSFWSIVFTDWLARRKLNRIRAEMAEQNLHLSSRVREESQGRQLAIQDRDRMRDSLDKISAELEIVRQDRHHLQERLNLASKQVQDCRIDVKTRGARIVELEKQLQEFSVRRDADQILLRQAVGQNRFFIERLQQILREWPALSTEERQPYMEDRRCES